MKIKYAILDLQMYSNILPILLTLGTSTTSQNHKNIHYFLLLYFCVHLLTVFTCDNCQPEAPYLV